MASTKFSKSLVFNLRKALPALILMPTVALVMSGIMAWAAVGPGPELWPRWGKGFLGSIVLLPFIIASLGLLERIVDKAMAGAHWIIRKIIVAALTACAIESVLALAVTLINQGAGEGFAPAWWMAFSRALPAGFALGLFMCFYMKPKLDYMKMATASSLQE